MTIGDCCRCCFENFFREPIRDKKEYRPIPEPPLPEPKTPDSDLEFDVSPLPDQVLPQSPLRLHSGYCSSADSPTQKDR